VALGLLGRVKNGRKKKVELVKIDANSDTQKVLEQLKAVLEKQGFKIIKKQKRK
tara:strand:+ start:90 stop:251 length:162 start_codon:yes stop_codon:yes gene_type:complete